MQIFYRGRFVRYGRHEQGGDETWTTTYTTHFDFHPSIVWGQEETTMIFLGHRVGLGTRWREPDIDLPHLPPPPPRRTTLVLDEHGQILVSADRLRGLGLRVA